MRCPEDEFRPMGRGASGVKGISLEPQDDFVIGMLCVDNEDENIMVVSENGFGKRSPISEYRTTHRGGKGVKTLNVTDKTGRVIAIENVDDNKDLMIINRSGITIRMHVADLRVLGRATQGVKLINLRGKDSIASITKVDAQFESDEQPSENIDAVDPEGNPIEPSNIENPTDTESEGETSQQ